jgi:hypothetical protein
VEVGSGRVDVDVDAGNIVVVLWFSVVVVVAVGSVVNAESGTICQPAPLILQANI